MHTYTVMRVTMRPERPLQFSLGEQIIAVLDSKPSLGSSGDVDMTVLVELAEEDAASRMRDARHTSPPQA